MLDNMPQSPFLPGTKIQFAWDSTSLSYLKRCPRLYYYHMIEGWVPKDESIHLRFGAEFHQAIHEYELLRAADESYEDSLRMVVRELLRRIKDWDPDPTLKAYSHKNKAQLLYLVVAYLDEFRNDPCETVILENGRPAVELSFRFELDWGPHAALEEEAICRAREQGNYNEVSHVNQPYLLCGHLDRVVSFGGDNFVLDHKTTTKTPTEYFFANFSPDNQMTLYAFAGKVVMDSPIKGVIVEGLQVTNEAPMKFVRSPTYRTDEVIDEWLNDLEYHLNSAEAFAEANYWPMNDTACGMYGGCAFREVCSKSPQVREKYLKADFNQLQEAERWNPLRSR